VEGYYAGYAKTDTVLTPLENYLTVEEWKEVIPMSAALARERAEPLIVALTQRGNELRQKVEANSDFDGKREWLGARPKLPVPVARLTQCLLEEAQATT